MAEGLWIICLFVFNKNVLQCIIFLGIILFQDLQYVLLSECLVCSDDHKEVVGLHHCVSSNVLRFRHKIELRFHY